MASSELLRRAARPAYSEDYRVFLLQCNGGYVGGRLWYRGPTPDGGAADAGVHHIGGFRTECHFSLLSHREVYEGRIPDDLLWIMDDPFGNAICIGLRGDARGRIYFWDHECEPDDDDWDGGIETAGNVTLIANSFAEFVTGLGPSADDD
ncbi:MAG: SMI1/KNR4 family protein [Polyangiaceae bacterium]|nr:SMI1/KNR4 family protein [Polyangiaceae bacterium]